MLAAGGIKHGRRPMSRRFGLWLKAGDIAALKRVEDIADRLVVTTERVGNLTGMAPALAGQQNLATAHDKTLRRAQPGLHHLLRLSRQGTKGDRVTHG